MECISPFIIHSRIVLVSFGNIIHKNPHACYMHVWRACYMHVCGVLVIRMCGVLVIRMCVACLVYA